MQQKTKHLIAILVSLTIVCSLFLVGMQSYFHTKEIGLASEGCLEIDGAITLDTSFLNLSYQFKCESKG